MINKQFEVYKLQRELKRSGTEFTFYRNGKNQFGEDIETPEEVGMILGLYHETNSNVQITTGDTARMRTEKVPMILCLRDSEQSIGIKVEDYTMVNDKKLSVTGIVNIQEWNLISDISLEVVDDGIHD